MTGPHASHAATLHEPAANTNAGTAVPLDKPKSNSLPIALGAAAVLVCGALGTGLWLYRANDGPSDELTTAVGTLAPESDQADTAESDVGAEPAPQATADPAPVEGASTASGVPQVTPTASSAQEAPEAPRQSHRRKRPREAEPPPPSKQPGSTQKPPSSTGKSGTPDMGF
jgi:hypothetical protein